MTKKPVLSLSLIALVFTAVNFSGCKSKTEKSEANENPTWQGSMNSLKEGLGNLQTLIYSSEQFSNPANREKIEGEVARLARSAKNVSHNPTLISRDPTVRFVSSQFSQDLQRTQESLRAGKLDFARYQLVKISGYCVECHARTQQGPFFESHRSENFLQALTPYEKAQFLVSSRRFEEALKTLKETLKNPPANKPFLFQEKSAHLALMVSVQYMRDPKQSKEVVQILLDAKDTPAFLKNKARAWMVSLNRWEKEGKDSFNLARIKKTLDAQPNEVDAMRSVSLLLNYLAQERSQNETGEALYWTGVAYESLNEVSPLQLHENYYESCIRMVPRSSWAKKCFTKLEDSIRFGYSGSSGTHMPVEVQVYLDNLKKEVE
jgi:hypothetical protein